MYHAVHKVDDRLAVLAEQDVESVHIAGPQFEHDGGVVHAGKVAGSYVHRVWSGFEESGMDGQRAHIFRNPIFGFRLRGIVGFRRISFRRDRVSHGRDCGPGSVGNGHQRKLYLPIGFFDCPYGWRARYAIGPICDWLGSHAVLCWENGLSSAGGSVRLDSTECQAYTLRRRAHNSAVECHLHTVEVVGSNPAGPTIKSNNLQIADARAPTSRHVCCQIRPPVAELGLVCFGSF